MTEEQKTATTAAKKKTPVWAIVMGIITLLFALYSVFSNLSTMATSAKMKAMLDDPAQQKIMQDAQKKMDDAIAKNPETAKSMGFVKTMMEQSMNMMRMTDQQAMYFTISGIAGMVLALLGMTASVILIMGKKGGAIMLITTLSLAILLWAARITVAAMTDTFVIIVALGAIMPLLSDVILLIVMLVMDKKSLA